MDKRISRIIDIARCLRPAKQTGQCFHVTAAFNKSRMVALGYNTYNHEHLRHIFGEAKACKSNSKYYKSGRHSEMVVLKRLKFESRQITFINVRIDNNNNVAMSKPCVNCMRVLNEFGFKKIYYTVSPNSYGIIFPNKFNLTIPM